MQVRRGGIAIALLAAASVCLAVAGPASAVSGPFAPLDRRGPPLSVSVDKLRASLNCTPGVAGDARNPILLVPGTDLDPGPNFSWNYERAFAAMQWAYCSVTLPFHTTGDIQIAGEYVVYAPRAIAKLSGHKVDVVGYSQGGMLPRWALRFWPDTRRLVHGVVSLDPPTTGRSTPTLPARGSALPPT